MGPDDLGGLDNPVYRHEFLSSADKDALKMVQDQFLSGNWYVFGAWASAVIDGKNPPMPESASTPHARFWVRFIEGTSPSQRKEFLDLLRRAQLANSGIRYRAELERIPSTSQTCEHWLMEYLSSFKEPMHSEDPKALLGMRLVHYSHFPEERMVRLAGGCLRAKALPALVRFLRVQRRFYDLHTDYSTSPMEIDGLFLGTLRTLMVMGASDQALRDEVLMVLEAQLADDGPEKIWVEHYYDRMGMGPPDRSVVSTTLSADSIFDEGPLMTKAQLIGQAISALKGDASAERALQEPFVDFPGAAWVRPVDEGRSKVHGDRLYYLAHFLLDGHYHMPTLWSVDIASGSTRFLLNLGYRYDEKGVKCDVFGLDVDTDGDPVLYTRLLPEPRGEGTVAKILSLDKVTGEVKEAHPLAIGPGSTAEVIGLVKDGHVLRRGNILWKQGHHGDLVWKRDLPDGALVVEACDVLAVLTDKDLEILDAISLRTVLRQDLSELAKMAGKGVSLQRDILLGPERFFLFDGNRKMFAFDMSGGLLWKHEADDSWTWDGRPRLHGDRVSYWTFGSFCILSRDGEVVHRTPPPEGLKGHHIQGDDVFLMTEGELMHQRCGSERVTTLDSHLITHMSKFVGSTPDNLLILFYKDHYYLANIPSRAWRAEVAAVADDNVTRTPSP